METKEINWVYVSSIYRKAKGNKWIKVGKIKFNYLQLPIKPKYERLVYFGQ